MINNIKELNPELSKKAKKYAIKTIKQCKNKSDLNFIHWLGGEKTFLQTNNK